MSDGFPVCARCGAIFPPESRSCELCDGEAMVGAPAPRPERFWVGLRASFTCRACGFLAPLDRIDGSGAVHCVRCGTDQAFDARQWHQALTFAHEIGDLAGPTPEGLHPHARIAIDSPWQDVGASRACVLWNAGEEGQPGVLRIRAFPGHPPCRQCAKPLAVEVARGGLLRVTCACGLSEEHQSPSDVRHGAVIGVIAAAHRVGKAADAAIESGAAFQCPTCGAPLPVDGSSRIVTCQFCHVASRLPDGAFRKVASVEPETIWIALKGRSLKREQLERETGEQSFATPPDAPIPPAWKALGEAWRIGLPTAFLLVAIGLVSAVWFAPYAADFARAIGWTVP
jgi:hypothetical protein